MTFSRGELIEIARQAIELPWKTNHGYGVQYATRAVDALIDSGAFMTPPGDRESALLTALKLAQPWCGQSPTLTVIIEKALAAYDTGA